MPVSDSAHVLREHTTIKIGGRVSHFFLAHSLEDARAACAHTQGRFYLLGNGSNIVASDTEITKPVVKLAGEFCNLTGCGTEVEAGAGVLFSCLLRFCISRGLGGLECLAGIPGTIGGMLAMNAASHGRQLYDYLTEAVVMNRQGGIARYRRQDIEIGYRHSSLAGQIILKARFVFPVCPAGDMRARVGEVFKERCAKQDYRYPSAGCIFKNPRAGFAGALIDACGLKGARRGGAAISEKHANFIVNTGCARYADVDYLIAYARDQVQARYGVMLEEEVERWI